MNICVFCSANDVGEKYTAHAVEFARLIGEGGHGLIWGGADRGLMRVVADAVAGAGGKTIGISVELLRHTARENADEMIIAKTLGERKATMLSRADALVVLAGGIGTLDEITEILELKKHKQHGKPVVILNTDNFYEGFKAQLQRMEREGFLTQPLGELVYFAAAPDEGMRYITEYGN